MILNFVVESDIATTQLLEQILKKSSQSNFYYKKYYLDNLPNNFPEPDSLTMFVRSCSPIISPYVQYLSRIGAPYIYFLDDNFWEIEGTSELALFYQDQKVRTTLELVTGNAQATFTNSATLAKFLRKRGKTSILLLPFFNFELLDSFRSDKVQTPGEIRIGFAGSSLRKFDILEIAEAIIEVANKHKNVVFEFVGIRPELDLDPSQVRFFDYQNSYEDYIRLQLERNWHIGLAPLADKVSNLSKTNNKFREYGAMSIPSIFSPRGPYLECVAPGESGLFADSVIEWTEKIESLIVSPQLRANIAQNAHKQVKENYSLEHVAQSWALAIDQVYKPWDSTRRQRVIAKNVLHFSKFFFKASEISLILRISRKANGNLETFKRVFKRIVFVKPLAIFYETYKLGGSKLVLQKILKKIG